MKQNRPVLVSYIVDLNILTIFLFGISLFPEFTERFGFVSPTPTFFNISIRIIDIIILIIISYGLLRLKRWGVWLMIAYNLLFLIISVLKLTELSFSGYISSILGLALTFSARRYFIKEKQLS